MGRKKQRKSKKKEKQPQPLQWYQDRNNLLLLIGLIALTIIAFSPVFSAGFVNWDDPVNIYENPYVTSFDIKGIFTTHVIGNYNPIAILSFAIDWALVGNDPTWYHIENLLFHLFNIVLVFGIFWKLGFGRLGSLVVAILFAIHPMRVESVAWITERKDVLYAFFYLSSIYMYLKYRHNNEKKWLVLTYFFFILSCLSKIQAVTLPLSLMLIDYWKSNEVKWVKWGLNKIPFFIISTVIGLIGIYFLREQGSLMISADLVSHTLVDKFIVGFNGLGQFLIKAIVPYEMVAIYPFPSTVTFSEYLGALLGVSFLVTCIYLIFKTKKPWTFGALFFLANIFFMLQFVDAGQGYKADRFTYIPYIGIFSIVGYYVGELFRKKKYQNGTLRNVLFIGIALLTITYSFMTYKQSQVWTDSETLWKHQIKYYQVPLPYTNLANYLRDLGRNDEALGYYNQAIKIKPDRAMSYNSRGKLYFTVGNYTQALADYENAIKYDPSNAEYYANRGATYANLQNIPAALTDFNKALELNPTRPINYMNRALIMKQNRNYQAAYQDFKKYLEYSPNKNPDIYYELAILSNDLKKHNRALQEAQTAISLNPNIAVYYMEKCRAYYFMNDMKNARENARIAEAMGFAIPQEFKQRLYNN